MTIDPEKAKVTLATLEREKQELRERLQLAAQAKQRIDNITHFVHNCFTSDRKPRVLEK